MTQLERLRSTLWPPPRVPLQAHAAFGVPGSALHLGREPGERGHPGNGHRACWRRRRLPRASRWFATPLQRLVAGGTALRVQSVGPDELQRLRYRCATLRRRAGATGDEPRGGPGPGGGDLRRGGGTDVPADPAQFSRGRRPTVRIRWTLGPKGEGRGPPRTSRRPSGSSFVRARLGCESGSRSTTPPGCPRGLATTWSSCSRISDTASACGPARALWAEIDRAIVDQAPLLWLDNGIAVDFVSERVGNDQRNLQWGRCSISSGSDSRPAAVSVQHLVKEPTELDATQPVWRSHR